MQNESHFLAILRGGAHQRLGDEARQVRRSRDKVTQARRNPESRYRLGDAGVCFAARIRREGDGARPMRWGHAKLLRAQKNSNSMESATSALCKGHLLRSKCPKSRCAPVMAAAVSHGQLLYSPVTRASPLTMSKCHALRRQPYDMSNVTLRFPISSGIRSPSQSASFHFLHTLMGLIS